MAKKKKPAPVATPLELRSLALEYPEVAEGTSCKRASFQARKKNFLFIGEDEAGWSFMLKLSASLDEAIGLATECPGSYRAGSNGWVTATFSPGEGPPRDTAERWVEESFRLLAPKKLVATLA